MPLLPTHPFYFREIPLIHYSIRKRPKNHIGFHGYVRVLTLYNVVCYICRYKERHGMNSSPRWALVLISRISQLYKYYTRHTLTCAIKEAQTINKRCQFWNKNVILNWFIILTLNPLWTLIILLAGITFFIMVINSVKRGVQLECQGIGYCT